MYFTWAQDLVSADMGFYNNLYGIQNFLEYKLHSRLMEERSMYQNKPKVQKEL
jgi:hypothetical protein